jgi:hypothetical protein
MRQAQPHRQRRRCLQRDHQPAHTSRRHVDRHCDIRPADRPPVPLVYDLQIHHRVVDLHVLQQPLDHRRFSARRPQRPGRVCAVASRGSHHRIQPLDPALQRPPRRDRQPPDPALPDDLLIDRRHRTALPGQIPRPDHLQQQRLDLLRHPAPATPATRPARKKVRRHPRTRPPPLQQPVHLTARDPQRLAASSAAATRTRCSRANRPITSARRTATDHSSAEAVSTPDSATPAPPSTTATSPLCTRVRRRPTVVPRLRESGVSEVRCNQPHNARTPMNTTSGIDSSDVWVVSGERTLYGRLQSRSSSFDLYASAPPGAERGGAQFRHSVAASTRDGPRGSRGHLDGVCHHHRDPVPAAAGWKGLARTRWLPRGALQFLL